MLFILKLQHSFFFKSNCSEKRIFQSMAVCESYCNNRWYIYRCTVSSTWGEEKVRMTPLCVRETQLWSCNAVISWLFIKYTILTSPTISCSGNSPHTLSQTSRITSLFHISSIQRSLHTSMLQALGHMLIDSRTAWYLLGAERYQALGSSESLIISFIITANLWDSLPIDTIYKRIGWLLR